MRFLKLSLRFFGFLLLLAVAVPILVIAILQIPAGRTLVSSLASDLASSDSRTVTIRGLHLGFALNAEAEHVSIADAGGIWLDADQIALSWDPLKLLSGELAIARVFAKQVDLQRRPLVQPDAVSATGETGGGAGGFSIPLDIDLQSIEFNEINLGETLLGAPISLTASGSGNVALDPAIVTADLDIHRIDGVDAGLTARAIFEPAAETLEFDISVSEPRGGLVARLLDVPDLPAVTLELTGSGPLTSWAANLDLALDGRRTVTGSAQIEQTEDGRRISFDLDGELARLAPPAAEAFLLGTTRASGQAWFSPAFEPLSADVSLKTRTVSLDAKTALTGDTISASGNLSISAGDSALIAVDLGDRRIVFGPMDAEFSASGQRSAANWSARASLASLQASEARTDEIRLEASGSGADLRADILTSPLQFTLAAAGFQGLTPETAPLSGPLSVKGTGALDGAERTAAFADLNVATAIGSVTLTETEISAARVSGRGRLSLTDLAKLSGLAARDLAGSVSGEFTADLNPETIEGSATVSLKTRDLQTGIAQADALMKGESDIELAVDISGADNVTVNTLSLANDALQASADATYRDATLTSDLTASLTDLSGIDPQLSGRLTLEARTSGPINALRVEAKATSEQIMLAGTPLDDLSFSARATADTAAPTATVKGSASLNGQPIEVDVELTSKDGGANVSPLSIGLAGNTVTGSLAVTDLNRPMETLEGRLDIDAPDLASLSPLLLTEISGRLQGTISADPDTKSLALDLTGSEIDVPSATLGSLTLKANVASPYTPQSVTADIRLSDLQTDVTPIHGVTISAEPQDDGTAIALEMSMDRNSEDGLTLNARVSEPDAGTYLVALQDLALRYQGLTSKLKQPTSVSYANGVATIQPLDLQLGGGSLSVSGKAGRTLDLAAELNSVPLNLANAFVPSLGLGGTLSGNVSANGSSSSPKAEWSISGAGLTANELGKNGLEAFSLTSSGTLEDNRINQTTRATNPAGLNMAASGTVGLARPNPLSLKVEGTLPSAALWRPMLEAGLRGDGAINLQGSVGGSAAAPSYQITATPADLKITSLSTGLTVQNVRGTITVNQDQASLNAITGDLSTGGSLAASGTVGMTNGYPADLQIGLTNGHYVDPGLVTADIGADLKISGPLVSSTDSALISGKVEINKADISIPESLPGAISPVDVRHINAPAAVRQQVAELGGDSRQSGTQQGNLPPRLDILLTSPGRIFIRGRGLDAELQGDLKIVGTTANPQAIGAFNLKRGQFDILTRRLQFSHGRTTFQGSLTPILDFAATSAVSGTTVTVTVSGQADDPAIAFSSSPEMPQDEVLALLLFGKSIGNLSATQAARLAAAIATLTGGSDTGPLASIRNRSGSTPSMSTQTATTVPR
ncbi:translocation/assembly module TamB domain-containing protein [Roseibium salinum]|uniref:translocation/assembly module TamB domain-containing protein n=1 Tax=Roseibium salinum TaxID=1604349 RepID=UPI003622C849